MSTNREDPRTVEAPGGAGSGAAAQEAPPPLERVFPGGKPMAAGAPWFAKHTGFLLSRSGWAAASLFRDALAPLGLKPQPWVALNVLDAVGPISQQALAAAATIDPSSMVAVIDEFERDGLVERRREPADRRRYSIRLTPKGTRKLTKAREAVAAGQERLLATLSKAERAQLDELLIKLHRASDFPDVPHPPLNEKHDCS